MNLSGNRHFYWSDFMTHQRAGYYASVRMNSTRTIITEVINSENLKGYYLSDGALSIYTGGDEYYDIYPVWDWRRIPGTTVPITSNSLSPGSKVRGETSFVGGVSNGQQGVAAMDLSRDGLTAKKSWFMFDNEVVALGAGINLTTGFPVTTSVNQCFLSGDVSLSTDGIASVGQQVLTSPSWVHHSNVGYLFPEAGSVTLKTGAQSGKWSSINQSGSTATVTKDVFNLWFDHGTNPTNGTYQYVVVPGISKTAFATYAANVPVTVLSNSATIQAVRHNSLNLSGIAYYAPGTVTVRSGVTVAADKACLVLFKELAGGAVQLSVSNPANAALTVKVAVSMPLNGNNAVYDSATGLTQVTFSIPAGNDSGKSIINNLAAGPGTGGGGPVVTSELAPVADATVYGGASTTNYGTTSDLTIKEDSGTSFDRQAYLRFDLQGKSGTLSRATLRFTATSVTNDIQNMTTDLRFVTSDEWTENGITWSNKPASSTVLAQFTGVTPSVPREIDVTAQVANELVGDKLISFNLLATNTGNRIATYASREHSNVSLRPVLILEMTQPPAAYVSVPEDMTVWATNAQGAVVSFSATATDGAGGSLETVCSPASGSTFPIGTTTVTCTASNPGGGNVTKSFKVTVLGTFASFQSQYGLENQDPTAEVKGIPQLSAYAFGIDPNLPDRTKLPISKIQDDSLHITYTRLKDAPDISYIVEVSNDLQNWYSGIEYTEEISVTPIDATKDLVVERDIILRSESPQRFIRVRILKQ